MLSAARVALLASLLVAVAYAAVVALLDVGVDVHLTGQVDRQLSSRLAVARSNPEKAFSAAGVQTNGARYGLGIYGEPIALWAFTKGGVLTRAAAGDPILPAGTAPPPRDAPAARNEGVAGTTYRLLWGRGRAGEWLLAGESLAELGHVEAVLVVSEAVALPFLVLAFFLVALVIGLRSARPVETARRRQLEFTADASHELRTPLSVIEAEVALARSRPREAASYEATLDRVAGEARRLRAIVEDLLFLARRDAEPAPAPGENVDLETVAREVTARFAPVAATRGQHLEVRREGGEPPVVVAPPGWLEKLLGTLVDNACRYSGEEGRIVVSIGCGEAGGVFLRVEDDGPGVPRGSEERLTGRFRRGVSVPGGHGLGLAIASSVAAATGGTLVIGTSGLGGALSEVSWPPPLTGRRSSPRVRARRPSAPPRGAAPPRSRR